MSFRRENATLAASRRRISSAVGRPARAASIARCRSSRTSRRRSTLAYRGSSARSGRPSTSRQNTSHSRSFRTASITVPPSPAVNGPSGKIVACDVPLRGGAVAPSIVSCSGKPIHSAAASSIETSMRRPRPSSPRSSRAARICWVANMPAAMSATGRPARAGASGVPGTRFCTSPSACSTSSRRSKAPALGCLRSRVRLCLPRFV